MPAMKKYKTVRALEKAIEAYFNSISVLREVTYPVLSGRTTKGKPKYTLVPVTDMNGKPIKQLYYFIPPSIAGLCLYLGISRMTWSNYAKQNEYAPAVAQAKLRIEAYLAEEIMTRDKVDGVKFNLSYNYGWKG